MNPGDLTSLLPLIFIGGAAIAVMIGISVRRHLGLAIVLTLVGLVAALVSLVPASVLSPRPVSILLVCDGYALMYTWLILVAAFAVAMLSFDCLAGRPGKREEFYVLLLTATLGAVTLVWSNHFAAFFLGLEILSVSLYGLIAYRRQDPLAVEAGIKYLVLGGVSTAFLLFGMALVYADLGTLQFARVGLAAGQGPSLLFLAGLAMIIVGFGFKLALVPFHLWTPDVYQGASAPVTAFIATVSKGAMFALLLRYFGQLDFHRYPSLVTVFTVIAIVSMFVGNLLALMQTNVKRTLAYSSIAHMGYLLVAFLAAGPLAAEAVTFYLVAYFVTTLGAFGTIAVLSAGDRDVQVLSDFRGLSRRRPWLAGAFTAMLLSLAGLPLTAGFIGKFYVLLAGVGSGMMALVVILIVNSALGLYYYLRIVRTLYRTSPEEAPAGVPAETESPARLGALVMAGLTICLIWLGVYPGPMIAWIKTMLAGLF